MSPWLSRRPIRCRALVTILAVTLPVLASPPALAAFPDTVSHWSRPFVEPLTARGIVQAYPDGRFHPDRPTTRAEFVKMLVLALGEPLPPAVTAQLPPVFADVGPRHWARPYVEAAWERGWTLGQGGGRFHPEQPITRAEMAAVISRAAELSPPSGGNLRFADAAAIPDWARGPVAAAVAQGLLQGYPDGTFRPQASSTRAEATALLARLLRRRGALYDLTGYVSAGPSVSGSTAVIPLRLDDGTAITLRVAASTTVIRNGKTASPADVQLLDEVAVITSASGPVYVEAWFADDRGSLVATTAPMRRLTYVDAQGRRRSRALAEAAVVFRNGRRVALSDLRPGDLLYLVLARDGSIRAVDAVRPDVRGTLWGIDFTNRHVRVGQAVTSARWYPLAEDVAVFVDARRADWRGLRLGDRLIAALDEAGRVVYVEAYRQAVMAR